MIERMTGMEQSICILGDSIAKGVVFDTTKNRYTITKNSFANRIANRWDVSVKNLSKFGSTVTDGVHRFLKQKDELEDCQSVLMNFGGNDSDFQWADISETPDMHHEPKTVMQSFVQTYLDLICKVRQSGKTPILLNLPPVDHKRYFSWISRELNGDNISKWLGGSSEFIYRWHEQYNIAVHKIARQTDVKLLDIRSAFLERRDYCDLLSADGIHPNEDGHDLIAEQILQQIES